MTVGFKSFTVSEYHCMIKAGVFHEDDHVELLDGRIRETMRVGPTHAAIVSRLIRYLVKQLPEDFLLRVQDPIRLSDLSEPEPDVAVAFWRDDEYEHAHPTPEDIRLLIEVADSTWAYDSGEKLPRYAQASVPELWIINVDSGYIEQHTEPSGELYRIKRTWSPGEVISLVLPSESIELSVDEILK